MLEPSVFNLYKTLFFRYSASPAPGGNTILTSPIIDLTNYNDPYVSYYRWFFNGGGFGTPNDELIFAPPEVTLFLTAKPVLPIDEISK